MPQTGKGVRILLAALLGAATAGAADAAPVVRAGTVTGFITVTFATAPGAGTRVSCALSLVGDDALNPTDSKFTSVAVNGTTATCRVPVRYKWTVNNPASHMTIAYSVSGPTQSSSGIAKVIPLPANNANFGVSVAINQ
jgi:hypothetical protein